MKSYQQIRCQRCRAVNPLGEELCAQCGTRLMLVVEPSGLRFEEDALAATQSDGLVVERLSAMEHNLTRMLGHLERSTDLLAQQSQIVSREHQLLEALISLLTAAGVVQLDELMRLWEANSQRAAESAKQAKLREELRTEIIGACKQKDTREFARLIDEGLAALERGEGAKGWALLERAAALAPENAALNALLGRQFFAQNKLALARSYLERACPVVAAEPVTCLVLAIARGDEGDSAGAHKLLAELEQRGGVSGFALHYARGRLRAHEGHWREALAAFKRALQARQTPEAHYLVALAAYQLGHLRLAQQHVERALALDEKYAAAFNLLGLIRRKAGDAPAARQAFAQARALAADAKEKQDIARAARFTDEALLNSFFGVGAQRERRVTGGDARLAALLRAEAQKSDAPAARAR